MWPIFTWSHIGQMTRLRWCTEITNPHWTTLTPRLGGQAAGRTFQPAPLHSSLDLITDSGLAHFTKAIYSKTRPKFFTIQSHNFRTGENINLKMINVQSIPLSSFSDKWLPSHQPIIHLRPALSESCSLLNWNLLFGSFILWVLDLSLKTNKQRLILLSPDRSSDVGSWSLWLPWVQDAVINLQYTIY